MSFLTEPLKSTISVDNKEYTIGTEYWKWLRFGNLLEGKQDTKQMFETLLLIASEPIEQEVDQEKLLQALVDFYLGEKKQKTSKKPQEKVFDFDYDAELIYSAFLSVYGIDLHKERDLHWHCFMALLNNLDEDNQFSKVLGYRSVNVGKIKDREQRKYYKKLKMQYALPKTEKEKQDAMSDFANMFI